MVGDKSSTSKKAKRRRKVAASLGHSFQSGPAKIPLMLLKCPIAVASHLVLQRAAVCVLAFFGLCGFASPQATKHASCVVEDIGTPTMPACVIQSRDGVLFIAKKYWMHPAFNRYGLSAFTVESFGRVYINRSGRIVIRNVALMDNGPDEFHHGLVRVTDEAMWGYADPSGRIVVPVKYSCAINTETVGPLICIGCRMEQMGEHQSCNGGNWFHADASGHITRSHAP